MSVLLGGYMGGFRFPNVFPVAETTHLKLREIAASDADAYFSLYSDERVLRTWGTMGHSSIQDTLALIKTLRNQFESSSGIRWALELKTTGEFIGDVGFWRIVPERCRAEAGAKLAVPYWSAGFMTEALSAAIKMGFENLGLHSIEANVDPANRGAIRLVEKVGFVKEGYVREHTYSPYEERFLDTELFSAVRTTWESPCETKLTP